MALNIYLNIPIIAGESQDSGFVHAIAVLSYSWGLSSSATIGSGGGGSGRTQFSDLNILKYFDQSSPHLMQALATGEHLSKMTLSLLKPGSAGSRSFLTYEFDDVLVTSIQDGASGGGDSAPTESVSFAAAKVIVTYRIQDPNTGALSGPTIFTFDQTTQSTG